MKMKRKFFSFISVSCATSIWLAPMPEAFAHTIDLQTNVDAPQALMSGNSNSKSDSSVLNSPPGLSGESSSPAAKTASLVAPSSQLPESSQPNSSTQTVQANTNNIVGGIFVIFLLIGYVIGGLQYRKYRSRRAAVLLQQIETLERIWKMERYR